MEWACGIQCGMRLAGSIKICKYFNIAHVKFHSMRSSVLTGDRASWFHEIIVIKSDNFPTLANLIFGADNPQAVLHFDSHPCNDSSDDADDIDDRSVR